MNFCRDVARSAVYVAAVTRLYRSAWGALNIKSIDAVSNCILAEDYCILGLEPPAVAVRRCLELVEPMMRELELMLRLDSVDNSLSRLALAGVEVSRRGRDLR